MGQAESSIYNSLERSSNCQSQSLSSRTQHPLLDDRLSHVLCLTSDEARTNSVLVSGPELLRLKKRFMKLDKDGSGSIDRDEFLQIPQIANNPLAHRMIAIFDDE